MEMQILLNAINESLQAHSLFAIKSVFALGLGTLGAFFVCCRFYRYTF